MDFFDNHGLVFGAIADAPPLSRWSNLSECWGDVTEDYTGEYSVDNSFTNTQIYYADLRDGTLVYYKEEGSYSGSAENDVPVGFKTIYADFGGGNPSCKGIWVFDAIPLTITLNATGQRSETITLGKYTAYSDSSKTSGTVLTAASDRSGYCGGYNGFDCYKWGSYQVVDDSVKINNSPCSCPDGECPDTIIPYNLNELFNLFESFGTLHDIDDYDLQQWRDSTSGWGTGYLSPISSGTYDYPLFVNIDTLPHGSFVTDASGNYFHSMITKDLSVFNKLNTGDPNDIIKTSPTDTVFYPIGVA